LPSPSDFFFQAEDGIRYFHVTGVQTCALPIYRQQEAGTIRAGGLRDAQIVRAEAEAEAARIYATAYGKDPEFYDFYRAMESYRRTFENGDAESSIILSPDNEYLRQFRGGNR